MNKLTTILQSPTSRWGLMVMSLLLVGWNSYSMSIKPLWSYHPLGWELGAYGIILFFFWKKCTKSPSATKRFGLSTLSGLLLAAAFPMSPAWLVMFLAFVPLLIIADDEKIKFWTLIGHAYHAFLIWNIITTFWVLNTSFGPGVVANTLNAFLMTLPWMVYYFAKKTFRNTSALVILASAWMAFEYLHLQWEISWPWLNIGNVFADVPEIVQWYEWTGCFGGALWIWALNILVFLGWKQVWERNQKMLYTAAALLIPMAISLVVGLITEEEGSPIEVVIVQPNYEPHYEKFTVSPTQQVQRMVDLAESKITEETDYVILPETVVGRVLLNSVDRNPHINRFAQLTERHPKLEVVMGASTFRRYPKDSLFNRATREYVSKPGDTTYWDVQNASLWLRGGKVEEDYFKGKLVPGAEIFPYNKYLPFLKPIIDALDGSVAGHVTQEERESFGVGQKAVAPAICYESIYGEYVSEYIKAGAKAIFIMTNDGWWDDTPGHKQHLALARLRAIEMRKSIARAANTGISCVISQKGEVIQPTRYAEKAAVNAKILCNDKITFYALHGDYIAKIAILITLITFVLFGVNLVRRFKR